VKLTYVTFIVAFAAFAACGARHEASAALRADPVPIASDAPVAHAPAQQDTGSPASSPTPEDPQAPTVDLSLERALIAESDAALEASDIATARTKATDAAHSLLARPESERNAAWLALLDTAGLSAWHAEDARRAKAAWEVVVEIRARTLPPDHPALAGARQNLAVTLKTLGDLAGARALQEAVLEVRTRTLPADHSDLALARGNLGATLYELGDLAGARVLQEQALEVLARTLPADHPHLALARGNLGTTLLVLGDLRGARELQEQELDVYARTLPADHPHLAASRVNLGLTLRALGDLAGARALQEQVLEVYARTLPADHPDLAMARGNLSITLRTLGDLAGARALQEQELEVSVRTLPADHPDLGAARGNLAGTLYVMGDLAGARVLQQQALEFYARTLPADHAYLSAARANLALTLRALGDVPGARALQEQVLEVAARTLPADHPDLGAARANLAGSLSALDDLHGARALEEQVLEVFALTLPADHPDLALARGNLALSLRALGDVLGARALQEQVLEVSARTLPADHPNLAAARQQLANTLRALGDLAGARVLHEQVLAISARTLPADHPDLGAARRSLVGTLAAQHLRAARSPGAGEREQEEMQKGRERCTSLLLELCRTQTSAAREALLTSSAREAEERCARLATPSLDFALSFAAGYHALPPMPELERAAAIFSEATRGAALRSATLQRRVAGSPRHAELRSALKQASDGLAGLAQQGTNTEQFQRALAERERLERELLDLARSSAGDEALVLDLDPDQLAARLGAGALAVGFRRYTRFGLRVLDELDATGAAKLEETSVASLCALVVRGVAESGSPEPPHASLTRIDLGPIAAVESAVNALRKVIGTESERGLALETDLTAAMRSRGADLRRLVFDPLLPMLEGVERVVVALDDVLHLVPLEALPLDEVAGAASPAQVVGERWRIETRCTLTEILETSPHRAGTGVLVALGGASFQSQPLAPDAEDLAVVNATEPERVELAGLLRGGAWERGFTPLTYTGLEAREIAALRAEVTENDDSALVLEKRKASRASLEQLASKARWLHVATHGWFAPESVRSWNDLEPLDKQSGLGLRQSGEEQIRGMSPMLLCGLALAGANLPADAVGRAPGLITAEEIAALDLSQCELAVLSACDTNVGERRAGQGVASLQRALQMAGARSVITSLWKVPDEATRELMVDFYRRIWTEQKPKHQALWEAKMRIRDQKDESGSPKYSVRDWAAWVLTGEPD